MENDNKTPTPVPFAVYECAMANEQRNNKRLFIALVLAVLLLFLSNVGWLYAWMQYDYVSDTYSATQDGGGVNVFGGGNVTYGTDSNLQEAETNP